jgi:hypothetical protein
VITFYGSRYTLQQEISSICKSWKQENSMLCNGCIFYIHPYDKHFDR